MDSRGGPDRVYPAVERRTDAMSARSLAVLLALSIVGAAIAPATRADEAPSTPIETPREPEPLEAGAEPAPSEPSPEALPPFPAGGYDGEIAIRDWQDRRPWRYGTWNLFPLTRGMDDAGLPLAARIPLYLFTVPFDLAQLPLAAIGGLYGG